jgi:hypothetical protein
MNVVDLPNIYSTSSNGAYEYASNLAIGEVQHKYGDFIYDEKLNVLIQSEESSLVSASEIAEKLNEYVINWHSETMFLSSSKRYENRWYKEIVMLGVEAVPDMISAMLSHDTDLFEALIRITGENPIKDEHRGIMREMKNDFISWWDENGGKYSRVSKC